MTTATIQNQRFTMRDMLHGLNTHTLDLGTRKQYRNLLLSVGIPSDTQHHVDDMLDTLFFSGGPAVVSSIRVRAELLEFALEVREHTPRG